MLEYSFDCPECGNRYWHEDSIVYVLVYDDALCVHCAEQIEEENRNAELEKKAPT